MAHAGLGHLWVVAVNEVSLPAYKNGILAGPLQFYVPEGEH